MLTFDRILLYVTSATLGFVLLFRGETLEQTSDVASVAAETPTEQKPLHDDFSVADASEPPRREGISQLARPSQIETSPLLTPQATHEIVQIDSKPVDSGSTAGSDNQLVLRDADHRPRIELVVEEAGPVIRLNDKAGRPAISLKADDQGPAEVSLHRGGSTVRLAGSDDGTVSVKLDGPSGRAVNLLVSAKGETEISAGAGPNRLEVLMRTDVRGAAEISIRAAGGQPAPTLTVLPSGDAGVAIQGTKGSAGPFMTRFADGLAEIAIRRPDAEDGPSLLRLPDGQSIVSVRHQNGRPAASLVAAPDGTSVIAAESQDSRQRAVLRVGPDGKPSIGTTQPDSEPAPGPAPQPAPVKPARPAPPTRGQVTSLDGV